MEESSYRLARSLHGESTFPLGDISLSPALCICTFVEGQCIVAFVYIGFVGLRTAVQCGRGAFLPSPVHRQEKKGRISFAARTKKGQFSGFPPPVPPCPPLTLSWGGKTEDRTIDILERWNFFARVRDIVVPKRRHLSNSDTSMHKIRRMSYWAWITLVKFLFNFLKLTYVTFLRSHLGSRAIHIIFDKSATYIFFKKKLS